MNNKWWLPVCVTSALLVLLTTWPTIAQVRMNGLSDPTFSTVTTGTVDTGQGANELYDMDQDVLTTSTPRFSTLSLGTSGTGSVQSSGNGSWTILGDGNGTDESLTFGLNSSNLATLSSGTGVATLFLSSVNLSAPFNIQQNAAQELAGATTLALTTGFLTLTCDGAETLATLTGGAAGQLVWIQHEDTDCTIQDDNSATAANAIDLTGSGDDVGAVGKVIGLIRHSGGYWLQAFESDN